jgi:hypothetical protein
MILVWLERRKLRSGTLLAGVKSGAGGQDLTGDGEV